MAENGRTYFDRQEVRDPNERERSIFHALPGLIHHAIDNAPFFREQPQQLVLVNGRHGGHLRARRPGTARPW